MPAKLKFEDYFYLPFEFIELSILAKCIFFLNIFSENCYKFSELKKYTFYTYNILFIRLKKKHEIQK